MDTTATKWTLHGEGYEFCNYDAIEGTGVKRGGNA